MKIKKNKENMYKQRNTNIPQVRTKTYKFNIIKWLQTIVQSQ